MASGRYQPLDSSVYLESAVDNGEDESADPTEGMLRPDGAEGEEEEERIAVEASGAPGGSAVEMVGLPLASAPLYTGILLPPPEQQHQLPLHQQPPQQPMRVVPFGPLPGVINRPPFGPRVSRRVFSTCLRAACCVCVTVTLLIVAMLLCLALWLINSPYRANYNGKPHESSRVNSGQLSNGFSYLVMKNTYPPGRFCAFLRVSAGAADEAFDKRGLAHTIEHMAFDSTDTLPDRNAIFHEINNMGCPLFNAMTTGRSTIYMLLNADASTSLVEALKIQREQVMHQNTTQDHLDREKGAILGEGRYRNGSDSLGIVEMLKNHGGSNYTLAEHITAGAPEDVRRFTVQDLEDFRCTHYRPERMKLFIVGDVDEDKVVDAIKGQWSAETVKPECLRYAPHGITPLKCCSPKKPILIHQYPSMEGVSFNLLSTIPYEEHPHPNNYYRRATLDMIFTLLYTLQVWARAIEQYPEEIPLGFPGRMAGTITSNEYDLGMKMSILSVTIPGDPQQGTWRRDLEVSLTELRRMAVHGPPPLLMTIALYVMRVLYYGLTLVDMPSSWLGFLMLNDLDPETTFVDLRQNDDLQSQFLDLGFTGPACAHVQAQAAYLLKSLENVTYSNEDEIPDTLYGYPDPVATATVLLGPSETPNTVAPVSEKAIRDTIRKVLTDREPDPLDMMALVAPLVNLGSSDENIPPSGFMLERDKLHPELHRASVAGEDLGNFVLNNGIPVTLMKRTTERDFGTRGAALMKVSVLGGKATQPNELKGACEFVNLGIRAGAGVQYTKDETVEYDISTVRSYVNVYDMFVTMSCQEDLFSITAPISRPCIKDEACDMGDIDYFRILEAVRLAMRPSYSSRSIDLAANLWEKKLAAYRRRSDPMEVLARDALGEVYEQAFSGDLRWSRVKTEDIQALDPRKVEQWVREQFLPPSRMEIVVVGDFDESVLLTFLDEVLGTIPKVTPERIGFDIYAKEDADKFTVNWPVGQNVSFDCQLPSVAPHRGYQAIVVPGPPFSVFASEAMTQRLANKVLEFQLFLSMRSVHGFGYFALVQPTTSFALKEWGSYEITWAPGNWSCSDDDCGDTIVENVQDTSYAEAVHVLTTSFHEAIVNEIRNAVRGQVATEMMTMRFWLRWLTGSSLEAPQWWPESRDSKKNPLHSRKAADDLLQILQDIKTDVVVDYVKNLIDNQSPWRATLLTVDHTPATCIPPP